ncbi:hypothetical protein [Luteibacter sp. CQ10]|uniref:hypothetical protein n=1 Tax=Luteibacter sp. CQ10 TaxID=2805821 RepID=UPI0034A3342E
MSPADIVRRFHDLSDATPRDEDAAWAWGWDRGGISWAELLASPRVLIVSEAGTGKSHECEAECARLVARGEAAFWVELSNLTHGELYSLFGEEELVRFEAWKADGASVATFFLDSIDELELTQASFDHALKAVSRGLGPRLERVRIVATSRPTAFDRDALLRHLPVPQRQDKDAEAEPLGVEFVDLAMGQRKTVQREDAPKDPPPLRQVSLTDLTVAEITTFVANRGVKNPADFVAALEAKQALSYAQRPQDLIELANAWIETGRLLAHREQVDLNVKVKLRRNEHRRDRELSQKRAREGAGKLALAMMVTRRLTLRYGDDSEREADGDTVLNPRDILADWKPKAIQALMQRGLFGHAGYGRVRMHHRSVVEYLAAEALQAMLDCGVRPRDVAAQLFATTPQGFDVLKPAMRPTAVWMAARNTDVFAEILARQPEALLQYGDPESLSGADRAKALFQYVDQVAQRGRQGVEFPPAQLMRLRCPEVMDPLPARWHKGLLNPDVRHLFLRLFAVSPSSEAADIAHAIAIDPAGDGVDRVLAMEVLIAHDDARLPQLAQRLVHGHAMGPDDTVVAMVMRLVPTHLSAQQLVDLFVRVGTGSRRPAHTACGVLTRQITRGELDDAYVTALREALAPEVAQAAVWDPNEYPAYRNRTPDLVSLLLATCARHLDDTPRSAPLFAASIVAAQFYYRDNYDDADDLRLRTAASTWPASLKRIGLIATDVLLARVHATGTAWDRLNAMRRTGLVALSAPEDGTWLLALLEDTHAPHGARAIALEALLHGAVPPSMTVKSLNSRVLRATADDVVLSTRVAALAVTPERVRAIARDRAADERRQKTRAANAKAARARLQAIVDEAIHHPTQAFSADRADETAWRLWYTAHRNGGVATWDRPFFERAFGRPATAHLKAAMGRAWRAYQPTLPHERPEDARGTTLLVWGMGNGGLTAESEDHGWAAQLSADEATLAARYIPLELNRFPPWLPDLIAAHPNAVFAVLVALLDDELVHLHDATRHASTLQHLRNAPAAVRRLILPYLEAWLVAHGDELMPRRRVAAPTSGVRQLLYLIMDEGSVAAQAHLRSLCVDAVQGPSRKRWEPLWFHLLFRLDAAAALPYLEQRLARYSIQRLGPGAALIGELFGDHDSTARVDARDAAFTPAMLLALVRLAYAHVRPVDDVHHVGVFSPGARDAAEYARNALLTALLDTRGPDGWDAKQAVASEPFLQDYADRARALSLQSAATETEGEPLTPTQAFALLTSGVVAPKNREQMFVMLQHRLDDLEDLLNSDGSPRQTWCNVTDEQEMRKLIGGALKTMAHGAYTVGHEMTTADDKETDIRLISTSTPETGVIELKIGNERPGRDLRDTIHEQLVKKYLRLDERKAGCLLVTVGRERHWDHPDTGERLDIDGLRDLLATEAQRVERLMLGEVRLTTHVMCLLPPLPRERKTR